MNSGYNLPHGCFERDLPGYNDIVVEVTIKCESCGKSWDEEIEVDPSGSEFYTECGSCGETHNGYYEPDDE